MSYAKQKGHKRRLTVSISADAARYLRALREGGQAPSLSGVVEALVAERKRQEELAAVAAQMSAYYDSLTPQEAESDRAWGEFAESQLEE